MIHRIRLYMNNWSLNRKILSITIFVNILMMSIASVLGTSVLVRNSNKLLYQSMANVLTYSANDISNDLNAIARMSDMILADDTIQKQLTIIKDSTETESRAIAYQRLYTTIQKYYFQFKSNHIAYISLYNDYFTISSYVNNKNALPKDALSSLIETAKEKEGRQMIITNYCTEYGLFFSRAIRKVQHLELDFLGTLNICVDMDRLVSSSLDYNDSYRNYVYLIFDDNRLMYSSDEFTPEATAKIKKDLTSDYKVLNIDGTKYFAIHSTIPDYNWDYIYIVSYDTIQSSLNTSYLLFFLLMILGFLISCLLLNITIRNITIHFQKLICKMQTFRGYDYAIDATNSSYSYAERTDEIGILHRQFDSMATEIKELIQVNYVKELLMKDAQIKALETQINPHFLYNTLESINWRAKAIGEQTISNMVESLGNLLRMTLSETLEHYTLAQELKFVSCYMTIQNIRFDDRLHFHINIEESVSNTMIPRLTIQPLIENSIQYALEEITEDCHIYLTALRNGANVNIYVKNNGSQFEDNLLEKLADKTIKPHGLGIGLININNRLKLTFGGAYGLDLKNEQEMAVVCITIPYQPVT